MKKMVIAFVIVCVWLGGAYAASKKKEKAKITVKIATIVPKGVLTSKIMQEFIAEVREETKNEVNIKCYWGGVQGDESDVIRKIRLKQLHGGIFSGTSLGQIVPEVRVTELPYLFKSHGEATFVRSQLEDIMKKNFEDHGYVMLGWFNGGFVYLFSNIPVTSFETYKKLKNWLPENESIYEEFCRVLEISPVPLSISDVMTSLSVNLIDTVGMTPFGAIAFRWYLKCKYMNAYPALNVSQVVCVTKEIWDTISHECQKKIKEIARVHIGRTNTVVRDADIRSVELLKKAGISIVPHNPEKMQIYFDAGERTRENLVGKIYSRELLKQTLALIDVYRQNHPGDIDCILK